MKNKIFSFINVLGLSIGLSCCMLIFLYNKDEISYDRFHKKKDNIYRITATRTKVDGTVDKSSTTGMMPGPGFKRAIPEIEDYVRIRKTSFNIKLGDEVFDQEALYVDSNFFSVFSFPLISGNPTSTLTDMHSIVLSEEIAEKFFGKKNAVGQVLELNTGEKFEPFTVSAVTKRSPQNSSIKIQMLLPMKFTESIGNNNQWVNFFLNTFIVLKAGADPGKVEAKFASIFNIEAAEELKKITEKYGFKDKVRFGLQPLLQMHLSTDYPSRNGLTDASNPKYSYILTSIALFILLIACINFINLTVTHSLKRAKEIGIRKAVGGQRKQLIAQFLGESLILSFIAFLFAILLVQFVLPFFNTLANKALSFSYLLDAKLVTGYIGLFLLTGLLAGLYPALVLSGFNPVNILYGRFRLQGKSYLLKGLVVIQFTLATFLIVATIIIYSQFNYLMNFDLGYNDKNIVVIGTTQMDREKLSIFKNELLKNSSIENVTADQGGTQGTIAYVNGSEKISFDFKHIDENYFPLFGIPVIMGRNFSKDFSSDTAEAVVINESFAKAAAWKDPLGKQVDFSYMKKKYSVVGIVKDHHYTSLAEKIEPQLFTMDPRYTFRTVFLKIRPVNTSQTLRYIENTFQSFFPYQPYQYNFKDVQNAGQYEKEAKWKQIITFGAILTIFISCIGLFGLAALAARKRTKEIGIRKVLGAPVIVIAGKFSSDFLKLVLLGIATALPLARKIMNEWLQDYPYRINISWWMFGFATVVVLVIALITVSFQAIKAAIANPVKSLRTE